MCRARVIEPGVMPPNVGVVGAAGGVADESALAVDGGNQRDVRQMRSAGVGIVDDGDVGFGQGAEVFEHRLHAGGHGTQMHRDMRRLGQQPAGGVEESAGKIPPLLDVGRKGDVLERHAHVFRRRFQQRARQLQ